MARFGILQLLYRVAFFCFCVIFACSYHHDTSRYDRRKYKAKPNKLKEKFEANPLSTRHDARVKRVVYASSLTEDVKQVAGVVEMKELKHSRMKRSGKF